VSETPALNSDFSDMLEALIKEGAEFVVVGAYAMAVHGVPRATGDIDIYVRPSSGNAQRVLRALVRFGAPIEAHRIEIADFERPDSVYQLGLPPRRIDLLTGIDGLTFDEAWASRAVVSVGGYAVPFLGRDALVVNKRAAGRPKDLLDVEALERARVG